MDPRLQGRPSRQPNASIDDQQIQSAKVTLLGALLKPEPQATKLTSSIVNSLHSLLLAVAKGGPEKSPEFAKCVARMVIYIAPSRKRTAALGLHMIRLANLSRDISERDAACAAMNFLHLIAAVFDCSNKASSRAGSDAFISAIFTGGISPHAVSLVEAAALRSGLHAAPLHKQIHGLQLEWENTHIFSRTLRIDLRAAARSAYGDWLNWVQSNYPSQYKQIQHLSASTTTRTHPDYVPDDSWYNAPVSAMIPHIKGQRCIKTSALDRSIIPSTTIDHELENVLRKHIVDVAKIFEGAKVARFNSEDNIALNGLGQPISVDPVTGKRKRTGPTYYGVSEKCARSFKKAREELPVIKPMPNQSTHNANSLSNVPPPMETSSHGFSGSYPSSQYPSGPSRGGFNSSYGPGRDGNSSGGNAWRGGGNSWNSDRGGGNTWNSDRGRGFGGRGGGGGGGRGRGRGGGWNGRN